MNSFQQYLNRKRNQWGSKFDPSDLALQFVPYFENQQRIEVSFGGGDFHKRGRVGITTGWKPCFLLLPTTRSRGSSWILGGPDVVVRVV
jgi:hypothetical protein